MRMGVLRAAPLLLAVAAALGCHGRPDPVAFANHVFYQYDDPNADISAFESPYPPLDLGERQPLPEYMGVSILSGNIHLSRPKNWVLAYASNKPTERFIEYVSPNEYVFSIYERVDSPTDLWRDVMQRYEDQVKEANGEMLGMRVPMSTWNAQGRAYVVRRPIRAAKGPFLGVSQEYLTRSDHRIVLVQIIHQTQTLRPAAGELYRVVQTLEIN